MNLRKTVLGLHWWQFLLLLGLSACGLADRASAAEPLKSFCLPDQLGNERQCHFPTNKPTILIIADRQGSEHISEWVAPLKEHYGKRIDIEGIADVSKVPAPLRGLVKQKIRKAVVYPVMLDWHGTITSRFKLVPGVPNVFVVSAAGEILLGIGSTENETDRKALFQAIDRAL